MEMSNELLGILMLITLLGVIFTGFPIALTFITVALVYTGGLQGTGDTRSPLYITLVSQLAIPVGVCVLLQAMRGLQPADIWMAILLGHFSRALLSTLRFRQGKWRHIVVDIEPARG